jgi:type VI protein secretion system component Hcp
MRTRHQSFVFAAFAAAISASAFAASNMYLKIEGVDGESASRAASSSIEVSSFSFGASNAGSMAAGSGGGAGKASMSDLSVTRAVSPRDAASGLPTGKRMHKPMAASELQSVSVVLPPAESSTTQALDRACASGKHIAKAELGRQGQVYTLSDVVVSSCTASSSERRYEFRGHVTLMK